jgi:hypothetical protein
MAWENNVSSPCLMSVVIAALQGRITPSCAEVPGDVLIEPRTLEPSLPLGNLA